MRSQRNAAYKYIILGAGAAGLSLCYQLLERGVQDPILLLDRKAEFSDDRTWCFWNVHPTPFDDLAVQCWHRWDVFDATGHAATQTSSNVAYVCLRSGGFYARVLEAIHQSKNVTLKLDCPIECCCSFADHTVIEDGGETYTAEYVFDSRPITVPDGGLSLTQRFFGQFVRTEQPCFDPRRCTLMDFRVPQARGLHFFYLLPFSPTEALVENTYLQSNGQRGLSAEEHRVEIAAYLDAQHGQSGYAVTREEAGAIPMTTRPFPKRDGRVFFIGTAGGCTKPSSGYTFARIQEQCRQLADAAASGGLDGFQERLSPGRFRFFDTVFLQAMSEQPEAFPGYFQRLFERVPPEALTAFLSETSTWRNELQIIRSLPVRPFLRAAVKSVLLTAVLPRASSPG